MADVAFYAQFVASKAGKNGIAVTWDIEQVTRSTGARAALVTGGATNIVVGRRGLYGYLLAAADLTLYDYVATAITADATVDQQEIAAVWTLWALSWHDVLTTAITAAGSIGKLLVDNINATVSGIPAAVWGVGVRTLTSFGTLVADITTAISGILCSVWSCPTRTLTMSAATLKSILSGSKLVLWRGDTLALSLVNLGNMVGATDLWFTVKKHPADTDATAQIQISLVNGLQAIDGAAATVPGNGSIIVNNAVTGNITINLAAVETAKLDVDFTGYYDIQLLTGATVTTLTHGCCSVVGDTTRRIV